MSPTHAVNDGHVTPLGFSKHTIDMMTTHGRFSLATIAKAKEVLPDPELPATPIMLALPHGGE